MPEKKKRRSKIWFDKACYKSRSETISSLHRVRKERTEEALQAYHSSKKQYKELLRQKRMEYKEKQHQKMIEDIEVDPYKAIRTRQPRFPADIPRTT